MNKPLAIRLAAVLLIGVLALWYGIRENPSHPHAPMNSAKALVS